MLSTLTDFLSHVTLLEDPAFLCAFLLLARAHLRGPAPASLASVALVVLMAAAAARLLPLARDAIAAERESGAGMAALSTLAEQLSAAVSTSGEENVIPPEHPPAPPSR